MCSLCLSIHYKGSSSTTFVQLSFLGKVVLIINMLIFHIILFVLQSVKRTPLVAWLGVRVQMVRLQDPVPWIHALKTGMKNGSEEVALEAGPAERMRLKAGWQWRRSLFLQNYTTVCLPRRVSSPPGTPQWVELLYSKSPALLLTASAGIRQ